MATAGTTHHIVLNSVGYMLRHTREGLAYKRVEVPYFVPRRAETIGRSATTRPGQNNDGFAAGVVAQFGQGGVARSNGGDARAGDGLRICTKFVEVPDGEIQINCWADFDGDVYAGGQTGAAVYIYKYDSVNGDLDEIAGSGAAVSSMAAFANYLWWAQSAGFVLTLDTSDTPTLSSGTDDQDIVRIGRSGTRLLGVIGAGGTRAIRWFGAESDVPPTTNWKTDNENGDPRETINGIAALGETFYLGKADGLYRVTLDDSGPTATIAKVHDHAARRDTTNFKAMAVFQDRLYYTVRDRLYRSNGSTEEDVTPPVSVVGSSGLGVTRYAVKALAGGSGWLWALTLSDDSTPVVHLWAYDGETWHQLNSLLTASDAAVGSLHYSPSRNLLFLNYYGVAAWTTVSMQVRSSSDLPVNSFETSGNLIYLAPFDGGLPDVSKRWHSVAVRGSGIGASTSVVITYWTGATWASVGSLTTEDGGEALFPANVTGRSVLIRLDLRSSGSASPVVREVGVTYDALPGPGRLVEFEAVLGPDLKGLDGQAETNTPAQLLAALDTCRVAGTIVTLVDVVGTSQSVRVQSVEVRPVRLAPDGSGAYGWIAAVQALVMA